MKKIETNKSIMVALSLILALAILFSNIGQFPSAIFADTTEATEAVKSGAVIVSEDETKRGEYERHYLTEDGSYVAISYSDPVNYLDDDGTWKSVDNSLSGNIFTGTLSTNNDKFKVKFANKADHDKLVSVKSDTYDISWGLTVSTDGESYGELDKIKVSADTKNTNSLPKTVSDASSLGAAVSTATYENSYGDAVDIRYTVTHQRVKEDVILKKPSDIVSYKATYNIKGEFNATLNPDGSVTVTDTEGETLFVIGAPWMYDAAGASTDDIAVSVVKSKKNLEVEYRLPKAWLNAPERVYPVTVDPEYDWNKVASSRLNSGNIKDVSVYMDGVYNYNDYLKPYNHVGYEEPLYLYIDEAPSIPHDAFYKGCAFMLYTQPVTNINPYEYPSDGPVPITATEILTDWSDDGFSLTQYSSTTTIYNNGNLLQFGSAVASSYDTLGTAENGSLEWFWIGFDHYGDNEADHFITYNDFFSTYKGVRIDVGNYYSMNVVSAENTEYPKYRPAIIVRYNYYEPSTITSGQYGRLKNVGSNKYLTIDGEGSGVGANIYQAQENTIGNQIVRFSYNVASNYYMLIPSYNSSVYVGYSDAITEPQNTYENVKLVTSGGVSRRWLLVPDGDSYYIFSELDHDHVMTAQGTESGSASTTGMVGGNIFVSYFSKGNNFQKWEFETCKDVINIAKAESNIYYPMILGERLYIHSSQPVTQWNSSDESIASINRCGAIIPHAAGKVTITASNLPYILKIHVKLANGKFYLMSRHNGKYLEINDGGLALIDNYNATRDQGLNFSLGANGFYQIYSDDYRYITDTVTLGNFITVQESSGLPSNNSLHQWHIELTPNKSYKLISKSNYDNENDYVISVAENNGQLTLKSAVYTNDYNFMDEWEIVSGDVRIVNHYIDRGFISRNASHDTMGYTLTDDENINFENAKKIVENLAEATTSFFVRETGIQLMHYYFLADNYSLYDFTHSNYEYMKVDGEYIIHNITNCDCSSNECSNRTKVVDHFEDSIDNCDDVAYILWSGHYVKYGGDEYRSCARNNVALIVEINLESRNFVLNHELAHLLGALDHYHEIDFLVCKNKPRCTTCKSGMDNIYTLPRAAGTDDIYICIMGNKGYEGVGFCEGCKRDIELGG